MNSFLFQNLDSQKSVKSQHRFPKIADMFRYIEICVVLFMLFWFTTKLQFNLNFSFLLQSFRDVCQFLLSPRFVFVVGNAIVLTLFVKSGQLSEENSSENSSTGDVYDEFVKNSESTKKIRRAEVSLAEPETYIHQECPILNSNTTPEILINEETNQETTTSIPDSKEEESEKSEKSEDLEDQIVSEKTPVTNLVNKDTHPNADRITKAKNYQRSRSDYMRREKAAPAGRELRRSKTEKSKEEMSNEEFQKTIEDFIARQVKFIREESMAVVLQQ